MTGVRQISAVYDQCVKTNSRPSVMFTVQYMYTVKAGVISLQQVFHIILLAFHSRYVTHAGDESMRGMGLANGTNRNKLNCTR